MGFSRIVSGSRSEPCQCPRLWDLLVKLSSFHHRSACKIVRRSRFWISLCLRSWRITWKLCVLHHRSACRIVSRSRLWISLCLRSWRPRGRCAFYTAGARVKSYAGAVCGFPCASVHGGRRGKVVLSTPQESVQNRIQEQLADSPVPQFMEAVVEVVPSTPQECVQNHTQQIMDFPVLRNMEAVVEVGRVTPQERVQNRVQGQIVDMPAHLITEKIVAGLFGLPQERVQHRATNTGKVFTVRHRDDQACLDNVGFTKGLYKHNMPRLGDVMVPPPQITKGFVGHVEQVVSWFDGKSLVAADEPLYRFQTKRSGRSSRSRRSKLKR